MNHIFFNGPILCIGKRNWLSGHSRNPEAVLVSGKFIAFVGSLDECIMRSKSQPVMIDLRGKTLLPAFIDTHTHFVEFAKRRVMVDLSTCNSMTDVTQALISYRQKHPQLPRWILGSGWDKNRYDDLSRLNSRLLDEIFPQHPVALQSKDYHVKWCNSLAL
ncbi:MAG: amidohydrolase family protein, partial [Candidatus Cloacimonadaceae bacterium]|nr:amidohydrolase family protein [Candidatus Cloacimonadaceae bacterium]